MSGFVKGCGPRSFVGIETFSVGVRLRSKPRAKFEDFLAQLAIFVAIPAFTGLRAGDSRAGQRPHEIMDGKGWESPTQGPAPVPVLLLFESPGNHGSPKIEGRWRGTFPWP